MKRRARAGRRAGRSGRRRRLPTSAFSSGCRRCARSTPGRFAASPRASPRSHAIGAGAAASRGRPRAHRRPSRCRCPAPTPGGPRPPRTRIPRPSASTARSRSQPPRPHPASPPPATPAHKRPCRARRRTQPAPGRLDRVPAAFHAEAHPRHVRPPLRQPVTRRIGATVHQHHVPDCRDLRHRAEGASRVRLCAHPRRQHQHLQVRADLRLAVAFQFDFTLRVAARAPYREPLVHPPTEIRPDAAQIRLDPPFPFSPSQYSPSPRLCDTISPSSEACRPARAARRPSSPEAAAPSRCRPPGRWPDAQHGSP